MLKFSPRQWLTAGFLASALTAASPAFAQKPAAQQPAATPPKLAPAAAPEAPLAPLPGQVNEEQLGLMLDSLGLKPEKKQQRYDFAFTAAFEEQEWELSMSAVLSHDQQSVWIMAWLDELPKSSNDVPRTALLRLLAENDRLGQGKFFAYIPANRRFVMQRVVTNENLTSAKLRFLLQDLGSSVIDTYAVWSVQGWNQTVPAGPDGTAGAPPAPAGNTATGTPPTRAAENQPKFEQPVRR
jgi:hypothetical protein